jgi:hypothetical protein
MRPLLVVLLVGLCACGSGGPEKEIERIQSWAATVRLALAEHARGAAPDVYTRDVLEAARTAVAKSKQQLDQAPLPDSTRATVDRVTRAVDSLIARGTR